MPAALLHISELGLFLLPQYKAVWLSPRSPSESEKSSLLAYGTKPMWVFMGIEGLA